MKRAVLLILLVFGCASGGRVNDDPVYGCSGSIDEGSTQEEVVLYLGMRLIVNGKCRRSIYYRIAMGVAMLLPVVVER